MIVRGFVPLALVALFFAVPLAAQDDASQKVRLLNAEYQAAYTALGQEFQKARQEEDTEKQQEIIGTRLPELMKDYAGKFLTLAEENAGESAGAEALAMVCSLAGGRPEMQEIADKAKEELLSSYVNDKALVPSISMFMRDAEVIEKLATESESREVRGVAKFFQMEAAKGRSLTDANADTVKPMMEELTEEYGDVHVLYAGGRDRGAIADLIENELFAFENLRIGKVAPEIEGTDIDDVAFKLSDYRGKVVVIDFWGDW